MERGRRPRYQQHRNPHHNYSGKTRSKRVSELTSQQKAELSVLHAIKIQRPNVPSIEDIANQIKTGRTSAIASTLWQDVIRFCDSSGKSDGEYYYELTMKQPGRKQQTDRQLPFQQEEPNNDGFHNTRGARGQWPSSCDDDMVSNAAPPPPPTTVASRSSSSSMYTLPPPPHHRVHYSHYSVGEQQPPPHSVPSLSSRATIDVVKNTRRPAQPVYAPPIPGRERAQAQQLDPGRAGPGKPQGLVVQQQHDQRQVFNVGGMFKRQIQQDNASVVEERRHWGGGEWTEDTAKVPSKVQPDQSGGGKPQGLLPQQQQQQPQKDLDTWRASYQTTPSNVLLENKVGRQVGETQGQMTNQPGSNLSSSNSSSPEPGDLRRIPSQEFEMPDAKIASMSVGYMLQQLKQNEFETVVSREQGAAASCKDMSRTGSSGGERVGLLSENTSTAATVSRPANGCRRESQEIVTSKPGITILKRPPSITNGNESSRTQQTTDNGTPLLQQKQELQKSVIARNYQTQNPRSQQNSGSNKAMPSSQMEAKDDSLGAIDLFEYFPDCSHLNWAEEALLYLPPTPSDSSMPDGPFKMAANSKTEKNEAALNYIPPPPPPTEAPLESSNLAVNIKSEAPSNTPTNEVTERKGASEDLVVDAIQEQRGVENVLPTSVLQEVVAGSTSGSGGGSGSNDLVCVESRDTVQQLTLHRRITQAKDGPTPINSGEPVIPASQYLPPPVPLETSFQPEAAVVEPDVGDSSTSSRSSSNTQVTSSELAKSKNIVNIDTGMDSVCGGQKDTATASTTVETAVVNTSVSKPGLVAPKVSDSANVSTGAVLSCSNSVLTSGHQPLQPSIPDDVPNSTAGVSIQDNNHKDVQSMAKQETVASEKEESNSSTKPVVTETSDVVADYLRSLYQRNNVTTSDVKVPPGTPEVLPDDTSGQNGVQTQQQQLPPAYNSKDKGGTLVPRCVNADMSQTFARSQMKSPSWLAKTTAVDLTEVCRNTPHDPCFHNPMMSAIVRDNVVEEWEREEDSCFRRSAEAAECVIGRVINTSKTELLPKASKQSGTRVVEGGQEKGSGTPGKMTRDYTTPTTPATTTDLWSTPNGLARDFATSRSAAPGGYPFGRDSPYSMPPTGMGEGSDTYTAWNTTNNQSGYGLQSPSVVTAKQSSPLQPAVAPGSYSGRRDHMMTTPPSAVHLSSCLRFPHDFPDMSQPPPLIGLTSMPFKQQPQQQQQRLATDSALLGGRYGVSHVQQHVHQELPPAGKLVMPNQHQPPALRQQHTPRKPIVGSGGTMAAQYTSKSVPYNEWDSDGRLQTDCRDQRPVARGDTGGRQSDKHQTMLKSQNKGIRKVNIAGTLVPRDQALSAVESLIELASSFRPAHSKPKSPDTADGGAKPKVHFTENTPDSDVHKEFGSTTPAKPREGRALKKRVSFEEVEGECKESDATSTENRSLVDLIDVPIVFKKAPAAPVKTNDSVPESKPNNTEKIEPTTPPINIMTVARKAMEEAVTRKKREAPKVVWSEPRDSEIGQFFVNKVFLDKQKTKFWQPKHLQDTLTKVLAFDDVVSSAGLQVAVVVSNAWIGDILEGLLKFPEWAELNVVCPKRSGVSPLFDEIHEEMCAPFTICSTHQDTMTVTDGALLEPSCVQTECTDKREVTLIHPKKSSACNCNFYLLRYTDKLRVVVFSGALNSLNWQRLAQYGWYFDFPIDMETSANDGDGNTEATNTDSGDSSEFHVQLATLLTKLGVPDVTLDQLFRDVCFDPLSPHVKLITAWPVSHIQPESCDFGIPRLLWILKERPPLHHHKSGEVKRICQTSKLGTGNGMLHLRELLGVREGFQKRKDPALTIVYPSKSFIQAQCGPDSGLKQEEVSTLFFNGDKTCVSEKYLHDPSHDDRVVPHANILLSYQVIIEESQEKEEVRSGEPSSVRADSPAHKVPQACSPTSETQPSTKAVPETQATPSIAMETQSLDAEGQSVLSTTAENPDLGPADQRQSPTLQMQSPASQTKNPTSEAQISAQGCEQTAKSENSKLPAKERQYGFMFTGSQTVGYGSWGGFKNGVWNFSRFELGVGLFPCKDEEKNEVHAFDLSEVGYLCDYTKLVPYSPTRVPYTPLHEWTKEAYKFYRCIGLAARTMHSDRGGKSSTRGVFLDFFKQDDPLMVHTDLEYVLNVRSALMKPAQFRGSSQQKRLPSQGSVVEFVAHVGDRGMYTDTSCIIHSFRDKVEAMKYYGIDPSKYQNVEADLGANRENWRKKTTSDRVTERKPETYEEKTERLGLKSDADVDSYWKKKFEGLHVVTGTNKTVLLHLNPKAEKIDCRVVSMESDMQWLQKCTREKGYGVIPKTLMGVFCVDVIQQQLDGHMACFTPGIPKH